MDNTRKTTVNLHWPHGGAKQSLPGNPWTRDMEVSWELSMMLLASGPFLLLMSQAEPRTSKS